MRRINAAALGAALACLLLSLLAPVAPVAGAVPNDPLDVRTAKSARTGVVVLTIRTPRGVPGVVALRKAGKKRWVSKTPPGTSVRKRIRVPVGRWSVKPQQTIDDSVIYTGKASRGRVRVRAGSRVSLTVTYSAAPAASDLRVTRIDPTIVDVSWVGPSPDAEYVVRMATGSDAPTSPTAGGAVPVTGTTATASELTESTAYSFSVFARRSGSTRWWGPLSTTVTTPAVSLATDSAVAVTNPATVLLTDPDAVDVAVVDGEIRASVPPGTVPAIGQPWVLPPSAAAPGGFVATVVGIAPDGGSVELAAAGLADAFDYIDIRVPDLSGLRVKSLRSDGTLARRAAGVECEGSGSREVTLDRSFTPYGDFNATLAKYRILGRNVPVGMSFDAEFGIDVGVALSASVSGSASCEVDLPSLVVRIPAGPVPLVMETEPVLEATVSGEVALRGLGFTVRLGATVEGHLGLGGDDQVDGELVASASSQEPTVEAAGQVTLVAGVETTVGPGFIARKRAGALIGLTAALNALDASATPTGGLTCLEVTAARSASVTLDAEAWLGRWDFSRSVAVPGLDGSDAYAGSPWRVPAGCSGEAEYRIADGTLAVDYSWAAGCSGDQGWCDDGDPNYTSSHDSSESSAARLEVTAPGPWVGQYSDEYPAYLSAPMRFSSWAYEFDHEWVSSGYGCSSVSTWQTSGPVEFGGSPWEGGATVLPGAGTDLDVDLYDAWGGEASEEWTSYWWSSFGAWDTDFSNGYPRVPTRDSWSSGGDCEGSGTHDSYQIIEHLQLGYYSWPEEGRRSSHTVTSTPLEGCTPQACRYQVVGTNTFEFRSSYAGSGHQGSGTATVSWSYVIERRDPAAAEG